MNSRKIFRAPLDCEKIVCYLVRCCFISLTEIILYLSHVIYPLDYVCVPVHMVKMGAPPF